MKFCNTLLLALAVCFVFCGCEHDSEPPAFVNNSSSSDSDSSGSSSTTVANKTIVGTWKMVCSSDNSVWYCHFNKDGSWNITNDVAGSIVRVYGTYSVTGNKYRGSMTNPGVGTGHIEGEFSEASITQDFVEYWHTPNKVVKYTGTKVN